MQEHLIITATMIVLAMTGVQSSRQLVEQRLSCLMGCETTQHAAQVFAPVAQP